MKGFMDNEFLLSNGMAQRIYHEAAEKEPVFDYHCHLPPEAIANNCRFPDLTTAWLDGDHYKWRAMRANGVPEKFITGHADPYERFLQWAATVPRLIGNPLYHWTHLELRRYFNIDEPLSPQTAPDIWKTANKLLATDNSLSVFGIFKRFKVSMVGTTDDPCDNLEWHQKVRSQSPAKVLPTFRPDGLLNIEQPGFADYIRKLAGVAGSNIAKLDDLLAITRERVAFFDTNGCRASDHDLEPVPFVTASTDDALARPDKINRVQWEKEVARIFTDALAGKAPDLRGIESWKTFILEFLAGEYTARGWVMQLHIGSQRNNNSMAYHSLGAATGYDAVCDNPVAPKLARLLDLLNSAEKLPKTVLYSLNPKDYYSLSTLMGCFQDGNAGKATCPGKMQLGSAWWFLDHKDGMEAQMRLLANTGLLSRFIGMLTDSRSFLSYPRHEYFRRILCNLLGTWAENGEAPHDFELLGGMAQDIAFRNAERYFNAR